MSANYNDGAETAMVTTTIPDRLFFRIGEVCEIVGVESYVLRFWESEFPELAPQKSKAGHRVYRKKDVEMVLKIKDLLYNRGFTIAGARKQLTRSRRLEGAERDKVLVQARQQLREILTLLQRKP
jgi:DNA-binding transcriptional MerR regulator